MRKAYALIVFTFVWHFNFAQSISALGVFPTIDHSGPLSKKLDYSFYYFGAFPLTYIEKQKTHSADFLLAYAEQAITYNTSNRLSFTASYILQRTDFFKNYYSNENRMYIQAAYKQKIIRRSEINLKHRLRFDNRFIQNNITDKTPYTHRLRYLIGADFSIKSKKNNKYIAAYEEAFFNTYKNAGSVYAENWAYAALGHKINNNNKVEAGMLYITWKTAPNSWFNQYYLQLTWINQLNFNK